MSIDGKTKALGSNRAAIPYVIPIDGVTGDEVGGSSQAPYRLPSSAATNNAAVIKPTPGRVLGISPRHFRRLLQEEHDAKAPQVFAVIILIGFEAAMKIAFKGR